MDAFLFYLHYLDINDLIYKMGQEMMKEIGEMMAHSGSVIDFSRTEQYDPNDRLCQLTDNSSTIHRCSFFSVS